MVRLQWAGMRRSTDPSSRAGGLLTEPTHTRRAACRQTLWLGTVCRLSRAASCGKTLQWIGWS